MKIACILLASGYGRRYGGNKLLTLWEGKQTGTSMLWERDLKFENVGRGFPDAPPSSLPLGEGGPKGRMRGSLAAWFYVSFFCLSVT